MKTPISSRTIAPTPILHFLLSSVASQLRLNSPIKGFDHFFSLVAEVLDDCTLLTKTIKKELHVSLNKEYSLTAKVKIALGWMKID